jgi:hypothetical protein
LAKNWTMLKTQIDLIQFKLDLNMQ